MRQKSLGMNTVRPLSLSIALCVMLAGAPLVHAIGGRAGWELRFVVQGGLRILERIDRIGGAALHERPTLGWTDAAPIAWRALRMRRGSIGSALPGHVA